MPSFASNTQADDNACMLALQSAGGVDSRQDDFSKVLAAKAASIADTAAAVIGLIDQERPWLKGCHGLSAREAPRVIDFCLETIATKMGPLVVPDASGDIRFANNRLVRGSPYIRLLAGLPLTIAGHRMGALCVIDPCERSLSSKQMKGLAELARDTAAWLERFMFVV